MKSKLEKELFPGSLIEWRFGDTLEDVEREVIEQALSYFGGNKTHTARALRITPKTLRNKLSRYRSEEMADA